MFREISAACFVPTRRIPAPLYAGLQILTAAPAAVAYSHVCRDPEMASSGLQAFVLVLIWVNFCILANRFHDANVSCIWLMPIVLLATGIYLIDLDPVMLGRDWATHDLWSSRLDFAKRIFSLMACATAGIAMVAQSCEGRNRFGMPFGEKDWTRATHLTSEPGSAPRFVRSRPAPPPVADADAAAQTRAMREALRSGSGRTFRRRS